MTADTPDTAKAIELLRQQVESGLWVGRATQADLVECFAAAVEVERTRNSTEEHAEAAFEAALNNLAEKVAKVTKGVLNNG